MLQTLYIRNYAIIDEITLSFITGYNVITGETGAGKSILLGALNLLRGTRADTKVLYDDTTKCIVEARFQISKEIKEDILNSVDLDFESDELIIRREISNSGKSRAFINDTPVRIQDLKLVSALILDIHNQFDTLSVTTQDYQIQIVDTQAKNQQILRGYKEAYLKYTSIKNEIRKLESALRKSNEDQEYVKFQLEELEKIPLDDLIKSDLANEHTTLSNSENIIQILAKMNQDFQESDHSVTNMIIRSIREINALGNLNTQLTEIRNNLENISDQLQEIDLISNRLVDDIDTSDDRLQEITDVLDHINKLELKHGVNSIEELIQKREEYNLRRRGSDEVQIDLENRNKELEKLAIELEKKSQALTTSRIEQFETLKSSIERSLKQLAIPNAQIEITREELPNYEESGKDHILFSFSANKGVEPQPINEVASGGELSRLALSIRSNIADQYDVPTLIFDEIDTGISGSVAQRVGHIFQKIAEKRQVICITHSPQVASLAEKHFLVEKRDTSKRTITFVKELDIEDRVVEIAQMLSTDPPSASAMENARELLAG